MSRLSNHRVFWATLRVLFAAAALAFLGRTIFNHWSQIRSYAWRFQAAPLAGSFLVLLVAAFFWATLWWRMVVRAGSHISWREGVWAYLISNLAKYVPGSIWGYVSRVHLAKDLTALGAGISIVWEVGTAVVASLLLTAAALPFYPGKFPAAVSVAVLLVALVCLVGLLPPITNRWTRLLHRRGSQLQAQPYTWLDLLLFLIAALVTHILVGTAFFLFVRSVADVGRQLWWSFVAIWSFSATAGLVVVLVPYGLGVKEGTLTLLMDPLLPLVSAAPIALASRLWTILGELLAAGVVTLLVVGRDTLANGRSSRDQLRTSSRNPE